MLAGPNFCQHKEPPSGYKIMKPHTALLCFALVSLSNAVSPVPLAPGECNVTDFPAGLLLEEINKDRNEGYVFSLFRVVDVYTQPVGPGSVFYLTVDVLESKCSVLSGKSWKDCNIRPLHETVFGRCKAILYLSLPWRRVKLYNYNCTLSAVPPDMIIHNCPDCPTIDTDTAAYEDKVEALIDKYNKESNNTNYFLLDKIERASMQWVFGPSYFVEFTIRESNCSKLAENISECEFLEDDKAHVGFCVGSKYSTPDDSGESVSCDIYDPKPYASHSHHRGHGCSRGHHKRGNKHSHKRCHGKGHGHHHHHHHHPNGHNHTHSEEGKHQHKEKHEHKHSGRQGERKWEKHGEKHREKHGKWPGKGHGHGNGNAPPSGEPHTSPSQKPHESSSEEHIGSKPFPPRPGRPISSVQFVKLANETDVFPIPTIPDPSPSEFPPGSPQGPVGPFHDPVPLPFPNVPSGSRSCPAAPKHDLPEVAALLPVPK
ncbi:fetuin-B-like [Ambystoma mexicanum]|uniref:fetuin-B-like n=1 Tax=Ambystoma mexicanum TaxID=8296 RepID=UPI0037E833A8